MRAVRAFAGGRLLLAGLWLAGLGALAAALLGRLPRSPLLAGGLVVALLVSIAVGVMWQRCGFFARPVLRARGVPGQLALTFDDGPDPEVTPRVLELLAAAGQRATFFAIGERVARHPELARRIVEEGHELANHSFGHAWHLGLWPWRAVAAELERASRTLAEASGHAPRFFRPPAAVLTPRIAAGARRAGLTLVGYSLRSLDGSAVVPADHVMRRLRRGLSEGAILVLHDARVDGRAPASLGLLPELLEELRRRGLRSVTLSALLAD